jgi:hypothetical protein
MPAEKTQTAKVDPNVGNLFVDLIKDVAKGAAQGVGIVAYTAAGFAGALFALTVAGPLAAAMTAVVAISAPVTVYAYNKFAPSPAQGSGGEGRPEWAGKGVTSGVAQSVSAQLEPGMAPKGNDLQSMITSSVKIDVKPGVDSPDFSKSAEQEAPRDLGVFKAPDRETMEHYVGSDIDNGPRS